MILSEFVAMLRGVQKSGDGYSAKCPAHDDRTASLSVTEKNGKLLVKCHAGCATPAVCSALGITTSYLFNGAPRTSRPKIVATYDYRDATGKVVHQTVRYDPKRFSQRRPNGRGGWIWDLKGVELVLFRLPETIQAIQSHKPVFIAEGEKDVETLVRHGFAATCNVFGADKGKGAANGKGKWKKAYSETLTGADVVIIPDNDQAGRDHANLVSSSLQGHASRVRLLWLPANVNGKTVKDVSDYFGADASAEDFNNLVESAQDWSPGMLKEEKTISPAESRIFDKLPKIQLPGDNRLLSQFASELGEALSRAGIYSRGGMAFSINKQKDGLSIMKPETLRTWVEQHLVCYKLKLAPNGQDIIHTRRTMTNDDAVGVLSSPQFIERLSPIERVNPVRMPVMRPTGSIELLPCGYDQESRTFTIESDDGVISCAPLERSKQIFAEIFSEFPFADTCRSKAVALSAMLTLYAGGLLPKKSLRPCFIYLANAEGAGKTLLVKVATVPVFGAAPTGSASNNEDEMQKALLAAVLKAKPLILFDNVKKHLSSAVLEGFLTSQEYSGRVLGSNTIFSGENHATVFVTGNGCTVSPDMRRRSLFSELFMQDERAEDRTFRNRLEVPALLARRGDILSALWGLVRDWDAAGRPKSSRSHSGFPEWAEIIGGIVEHAGYGCPLESPNIEAAADTNGADMHELVLAMAVDDCAYHLKFEEIVDLAREKGLFEWIIPPGGEIDPNAKAKEKEMDRSAKSKLAKLLNSYKDRLMAGYRFQVHGKGRARRYSVKKMEQGTVNDSEEEA